MKKISFIEAIKICFKKSFDFSGRTRRSEFWFFSLFSVLVYIPVILFKVENYPHLLKIIFYSGMFFPALSVTIRRLHDVGKSGIFYLILYLLCTLSFILAYYNSLFPNNQHYGEIQISLLILYLIFLSFDIFFLLLACKDSDHGLNKYGDSSKYPETIETPKKESSQPIQPENSFLSPHSKVNVIANVEKGSDIKIQLQRIKDLFEQNLIDEVEYKAKKAQVLGL